jgi:hypothetical protein
VIKFSVVHVVVKLKQKRRSSDQRLVENFPNLNQADSLSLQYIIITINNAPNLLENPPFKFLFNQSRMSWLLGGRRQPSSAEKIAMMEMEMEMSISMFDR